jgi:hypothetical protein
LLTKPTNTMCKVLKTRFAIKSFGDSMMQAKKLRR